MALVANFFLEIKKMGNKSGFGRREFLKNAGRASVASVFALPALSRCVTASPDSNAAKAMSASAQPQIPTSQLGRTGVKVPILNLGGMFDIPDNQIMLKKAIDWGITYWDTAHSYGNGQSQVGIGNYLKKRPEIRKKLFIVTKASGAKSVKDIESRLQNSLKAMHTNYIDLYYGVHGLNDPGLLSDELRDWAAGAKKRGLIKYFGFSTHKNMANCLNAAARLDWIDAIMTTYNFRQMQLPAMESAIEACHKAGIGLIAMKTQAGKQKAELTESEKKLTAHFISRGFTTQQANLKAVWQDKRIATICSQMPNMSILVSNVAAALDRTELSSEDMGVYSRLASAECSGYCLACGACDAAVEGMGMGHISEVMRYMMYYNSYGQRNRARELFASLPYGVRSGLADFDYGYAEKLCPQKMPIAELMREAKSLLT